MDANTIEKRLDRLSAGQQERVRAALASLDDGRITEGEFMDLVSTTLLVGNAKGYALGSAVARTLVEEQTGKVELTPASSDGKHLDESRLRDVLGVVLASEGDHLMQLQRLADNEPKQSAANGSHDVLKASKRVTGWKRTLNADACDLCRHWEREGRVWQPNHAMARHTGCTCQQTPVTTTPTSNYQTEKQAADRKADRRSPQ